MPWEKKYDATEVLERSARTFWSRGYADTSIADIVAATGVNRGSLYAAFSDKRGLFRAVLDHYDAVYRAEFLDHLKDRLGPREAIIEAFCQAGGLGGKTGLPPGCLLVNTALEISPHDPEIAAQVRASLDRLKTFFIDRIGDAISAGELPHDFPANHAAGRLFALFIGLRVMARAGLPDDDRNAIVTDAAGILR